MNRTYKNLLFLTAPLLVMIILLLNDPAVASSFIIALASGTVLAAFTEDRKFSLGTLCKWAAVLSITFGIISICFYVQFTMNNGGYYLLIYAPSTLITVLSYLIVRKWTAGMKALGILSLLFIVLFTVTGEIKTAEGYAICVFLLIWLFQSAILAWFAYLVKKIKIKAAAQADKERNKSKIGKSSKISAKNSKKKSRK
ncbi:MAG: hypothetical protein Q8930_17415 [Bacillota bacterium]|nr:hypothetical protein [Bacillota bacterium]